MTATRQQAFSRFGTDYMPTPSKLLQRQCACGTHTGGGECAECRKRKSSLQRKLAIGASNDPLEMEADRVANQVMTAPAHVAARGASPRIQRFSEPSIGSMDTAPASVDRVLAGNARSLEPSLRHDMEQRFSHDFSRVRVHSGPEAEESAREVNAHAYTVGHDIVFGAGQWAPETHHGRRLIAHELTHVVQQQGGGQPAVQRAPAGKGSSLGLTIGEVDVKSADPNCAYQKGEAARAQSSKGILDYDIEKAEFFGIDPPDAVVIADFKIDDGELRPSTERDFRKYWLPTFDKSTLGSLEIVGFNDCVGWESRNKALREQRARAVARLLPGVPVSTAGFDEYPVPNTSERGRALNRSVIIRPRHKVPPPPPPPKQHEVTITKQEPDTKNCSADQRKQLSIAFPAAKLMAQRARAAVLSPNRGPVTDFLLERYFGEDALSHLPEIHDGFSKILSRWTDWDSRFDCELQTEEHCKSDKPEWITLAYVRTKGHLFSPRSAYGTVHVCEAAFANPGNMQEISATLLHELSHRLDNTSDKKYCEAGDGWCADLSAKAAIDNADSYAQFAREIFNTSM